MLVALAILCIDFSFAQVSNSFVIKTEDDLANAQDYIFKYPQFQNGKVYFRNGDVSAAKLNYNFLLQAIEFITEKGDTLALANEATVKIINIGSDTFFYSTTIGYIQQAADYSFTKLLLKQSITSDEKKIGAYGIPSSTHGIESKDTYVESVSYKLSKNEDVVLTKRKKYYFSDANFNLYPVNNKNILKVFQEQRGKIDTYFRSNKIDFNSEDDLKKFFSCLKDNL